MAQRRAVETAPFEENLEVTTRPKSPLEVDETSSSNQEDVMDPEGLGLFSGPKFEEASGAASIIQSLYMGDFQHVINLWFAHRGSMCNAPGGDQIHHFNWFGVPVYERSYTPPEVSLWFMQTKPKAVINGSPDSRRKFVLVKEAKTWIDPVCMDNSCGGDLPRHAGTLLSYAKNRTKKFYSPHGWWCADIKERDNIDSIDDGSPGIYWDQTKHVGSGMLGRPGTDGFGQDRYGDFEVPSNEQWDRRSQKAMEDEVEFQPRRPKRPRREFLDVKDTKAFEPSPLRCSTIIRDIEPTGEMPHVGAIDMQRFRQAVVGGPQLVRLPIAVGTDSRGRAYFESNTTMLYLEGDKVRAFTELTHRWL
ncbi:hypothetical protein BJX99DRAFT_263761 [Aspergillus californicus]